VPVWWPRTRLVPTLKAVEIDNEGERELMRKAGMQGTCAAGEKRPTNHGGWTKGCFYERTGAHTFSNFRYKCKASLVNLSVSS